MTAALLDKAKGLYRWARSTKPEPGHKIFPYLLRGVEITRPKHVWAMDIDYIARAEAFVFLAIRLVLAARLIVAPVDHVEDGVLRRG